MLDATVWLDAQGQVTVVTADGRDPEPLLDRWRTLGITGKGGGRVSLDQGAEFLDALQYGYCGSYYWATPPQLETTE